MNRTLTFSIIIIALILSTSNRLFGQETVEEFGKVVFYAFKNDSLSILLKLYPTSKQLKKLMKELGVDPKSLNIKNFDTMREEGLIKFQEKFKQIRNDTARLDMFWKDAIIKRISIEQQQGQIATSNQKGKWITMTIIDIFFISNKKKFVMTLEDSQKYKKKWTIGSNIHIIEIKKE